MKADSFVEKKCQELSRKTLSEKFQKLKSEKILNFAENLRNDIFLSKMEIMSKIRSDCLCPSAISILTEFVATWKTSYLSRTTISIRKTERHAMTVPSMLFKLFRNRNKALYVLSGIDSVSCPTRKARITHFCLEYKCHMITL